MIFKDALQKHFSIKLYENPQEALKCNNLTLGYVKNIEQWVHDLEEWGKKKEKRKLGLGGHALA